MSEQFRQQVIDAEEQLRKAMLTNDVAVLDDLLASNLLFTGHVGQLATKEDDLAAHRLRLVRLERAELVEQHMQLHANFAVVSSLMHLVGTYVGDPIDQHMRYTRIWVISPDGKLQLTAGHMGERTSV